MSDLRDKLVKENEDINWEPKHIKEGRFGEWLKEIKDWAISRERYWGTPLPIWINEKGEKIVIGSVADLKKYSKKSGNKYFVMRHAESENNAANIVSHDPGLHHLTEKGKAEALEAAKYLKGKKIDVIYASPFLRTQETAEIVAEELGLSKDQIITDNRIREFNFGDLHLKSFTDFITYRDSQMTRLEDKLPNGESYLDSKKRVGDFLYEVDKKHLGKNILVVGHGVVLEAFPALVEGANSERSKHFVGDVRAKNAEIREYDFVPLPHNENYELDLHKPYIDEVELVGEKGDKLTRVKEVMDVWFDSGSMPFASEVAGYPADFISEAIDQTRGWFYTLHAIGVLMGKGRAYKNVVCLGHILDDKGKKMSKSLGNIVDPWIVSDKYGVDALRLWMYSVNQPGDSKNFDEKTVDEIVKKVFNPLENILSFYFMYADRALKNNPYAESKNILDQWILARLNEVLSKGSEYLDNYKIFEASRLVRDFVNDFSTWYVRRSRDRFKSDDVDDRNAALATTRFVLIELAKYMAPFTPFFSEYLYRELRADSDLESVHLATWPKIEKPDTETIKKMEEVRRLVSLGLEKRNAAGVKVRQPLSRFIFTTEENLGEEYLVLIKDEMNVKEVSSGSLISLDTNITPELKKEGDVREFIRAVQDLRKEKDLTPDQKITLLVETSEEGKAFVESARTEIVKPTNILDFSFGSNSGKELEIGNLPDGKAGWKFKISLGDVS